MSMTLCRVLFSSKYSCLILTLWAFHFSGVDVRLLVVSRGTTSTGGKVATTSMASTRYLQWVEYCVLPQSLQEVELPIWSRLRVVRPAESGRNVAAVQGQDE